MLTISGCTAFVFAIEAQDLLERGKNKSFTSTVHDQTNFVLSIDPPRPHVS
jgi:hypothetical protein